MFNQNHQEICRVWILHLIVSCISFQFDFWEFWPKKTCQTCFRSILSLLVQKSPFGGFFQLRQLLEPDWVGSAGPQLDQQVLDLQGWAGNENQVKIGNFFVASRGWSPTVEPPSPEKFPKIEATQELTLATCLEGDRWRHQGKSGKGLVVLQAFMMTYSIAGESGLTA